MGVAARARNVSPVFSVFLTYDCVPLLLSLGADESLRTTKGRTALEAAREKLGKVDREERPDLDKIYQTAHHFIAQRGGGWPLTMFLTPEDHVPFFGGTYFPDTAKYGMPSFTQVLERVAADAEYVLSEQIRHSILQVTHG